MYGCVMETSMNMNMNMNMNMKQVYQMCRMQMNEKEWKYATN